MREPRTAQMAVVVAATASAIMLLATPSPAQESTGPCNARPYRAVGGALQCIPYAELTLEDLAAHLAPVLWFGEHEPLRLNLRQFDVGADPPIPTALPEGDEWRLDATVYWRATKAILAPNASNIEGIDGQGLRARYSGLVGRDRLLSKEAALSLKRLDLTIRYFFYYPREVTHSHDLESAEVELVIEYDKLNTAIGLQACDHVPAQECWMKRDGATWLRVKRVTGAAHGLGFYSNTLSVQGLRTERGASKMSTSDALPADRWTIGAGVDNWISIPVTVLVEEGKHASAPDADADGQYVPGVDVNEYVGDSWGIRDSFGRKFLGGARFGSEMTMRRVEQSRVGSRSRPQEFPAGYVLTPTEATHVCGDVWRDTYNRSRLLWSRELKDELVDLLDKMGFCGGVDVLVGWDALRVIQSWPRPYGGLSELFTIAYRYDSRLGGDPLASRQSVVFTVLPNKVPYFHHYVSLRVQLGLRSPAVSAADLIWSPSASRLADPYVAVGREAHQGAKRPDGRTDWDTAIEGGFKLRIPWESAPLPLFRLLGVRAGARLGRPHRPSIGERVRLVVEVGGGAY
jgi:hypothetical protein